MPAEHFEGWKGPEQPVLLNRLKLAAPDWLYLELDVVDFLANLSICLVVNKTMYLVPRFPS